MNPYTTEREVKGDGQVWYTLPAAYDFSGMESGRYVQIQGTLYEYIDDGTNKGLKRATNASSPNTELKLKDGYDAAQIPQGTLTTQTQNAQRSSAIGLQPQGSDFASGQVGNNQIAPATIPTQLPEGSGGPEGSTSGGTYPGQQTQSDADFQAYLGTLNLTADQKQALEAIYDAVSTGDQEKAGRLKSAMQAATEFSDPYFKAQTRLALDALDRSFGARDGDLVYGEEKLRTALEDLQADIEAGKDYLSFQELQEMKALERNLKLNLEATAEEMAAKGFTSSSIRSKKEGILTETFGDMRESTRRSFEERQSQLTNQGNRAGRDTAAEIARLHELTTRGKLDDYRKAEATVGSANLPTQPGVSPLGGIGGTIPEAQVKDSMAFAQNFVF